MHYEPRTYRNISPPEGLVRFDVLVQETDLCIYARYPMEAAARELVLEGRSIIEKYIQRFPYFARTLSPWGIDGPAPRIVRKMAEAGENAGVGPMAAVAGVVAEYVGRGLLTKSVDVIVENGGDVFIHASPFHLYFSLSSKVYQRAVTDFAPHPRSVKKLPRHLPAAQEFGSVPKHPPAHPVR